MSSITTRRPAKKAAKPPAKPADPKAKPSPRATDSDRVTEAVHTVVRKHPGNIVAAIAETAGVNAKQVSSVLAKLEAAGRVVRTVNGRMTTWSPAKVNKSGSAKLGKGELDRQVMQFLSERPAGTEFTPGDIGRKLGRSPGAVLNVLVKHTATGNVAQTKDKPATFARATSSANGSRARKSTSRKKAA